MKKLIYENSFSEPSDVEDFILEGNANISFKNNRLQLENALDPSLGQQSNYVFWCPVEFPSDIEISFEFYPIQEPGLSMLFFSAKGKNNEDLFDHNLKKRDGQYSCYLAGDINTFHISYFRRRYENERCFHACNLRKSCGGNIVATGADPIPNVEDARPPYFLRLIKNKEHISFYINDLEILNYYDDGLTYGALLKGGKIGFRQMAPLIAEYSNFRVYQLEDD